MCRRRRKLGARLLRSEQYSWTFSTNERRDQITARRVKTIDQFDSQHIWPWCSNWKKFSDASLSRDECLLTPIRIELHFKLSNFKNLKFENSQLSEFERMSYNLEKRKKSILNAKNCRRDPRSSFGEDWKVCKGSLLGKLKATCQARLKVWAAIFDLGIVVWCKAAQDWR